MMNWSGRTLPKANVALYEEIADEYRAEIERGNFRSPVKTIAERRGVKVGTVGFWVRRARQHGLLEPFRIPECFHCHRPYLDEDEHLAFRGAVSIPRLETSAYRLEERTLKLLAEHGTLDAEIAGQLKAAATFFERGAHQLGLIAQPE
jgi:hypothetical protein